MDKLSATISKLAAFKTAGAAPAFTVGRLQELKEFGSNPGSLRAKIHVPAHLTDKPALVVVLHGCTQTAEGYDLGSGWSVLANEKGFTVLFPEQQGANNPNLCFNWFSPADNARDRGEALSIRQMIAAMIDAYDIDESRIFVTGLSAGGAMTSILLATYPELFAGGAIIAGLPYGSASNVSQALGVMRSAGKYSGDELGDRVRDASGHIGPWPHISVWHGTADATVNATNADAIVAQWISVKGLRDTPNSADLVAGHRRRIWNDAAGRSVLEDYRIENMGHGAPLATMGEEPCGKAMPHMLEAGISSTHHIATSWGLTGVREAGATPHPVQKHEDETPNLPNLKTARLERLHAAKHVSAAPANGGIEKIIHDALRSAGLMR